MTRHYLGYVASLALAFGCKHLSFTLTPDDREHQAMAL